LPERALLDPRITLATVAATSVVVLSPPGTRFVPAGLLLGMGLAVSERAWRRAVLLPAVLGVFAVLAYVLPLHVHNPVVTVVAIGSAYAIRFVVVAGVAMHLVATVPPMRMAAALRSWRLPRGLSVTTAVMLRFFPIVAGETRAVVDAMRLRGLVGVRGVLSHPVLAVERFTVPVIASTLRVGEDLSASAILRGLGSPHRPTAMNPPGMTWRDAAFVALVAVLAVASLLVFPEVA
jgi:energy-coupling factor transport system permease protein